MEIKEHPVFYQHGKISRVTVQKMDNGSFCVVNVDALEPVNEEDFKVLEVLFG